MTSRFEPRVRRAFAALLAALFAVLLTSCGGDDQLARTGGGGTGIATTVGTVTGFGSVIVDGEGWDDRNARVEVERSPAAGAAATEARLGQRVQIDYTSRGTADRVVVEPEVIGRVSEVNAVTSPPQFKVAGQTVRTNSDPAAGPVTVFEGVAGVAALQVDDAVEVHGSARFDTVLGRYVVVASRVEKLAGLPTGLVRISGVVASYSATERRFRLGELTVSAIASTVQVPANRALADGQRVIVWSDDPLGSAPGGPTLTADFIRIVERSTGNGARSEISGLVSGFDANSLNLLVNGIPVNARAATIVPASQLLADGRYVIASGSFDTAGVLQAQQVRIRLGNASDSEVRLDGTITDFVSVASFRVRGTRVDASGVNALPGCPSGGLANGLFVETGGRISPVDGRVEARRLRCIDNPVGRVITVDGVASNVSTAMRSFTLTPAGAAARTVTWTPVTYFDGVMPDTLAGRRVSVEGYGDADNLVATKVRQLP